MRFQRILALVDFSEGSNAAVEEASAVALAHGAELHLLHAYGPRGIVPEASFVENGRIASDQLNKVVDKLTADGISATGEVHPGSPLDAFDAIEDAITPDLVVAGARGASRLRTLLLGSVARAVVEHAFAPVLIVRGEPAQVPYQRVLLGSDFSPDAAAASVVARALTPPGGDVHIVHVDGIPHDAIASLGSAAIDKLRQESRRQLEEEAKAIGAVPHVGFGNPAKEIVSLARELDCDLIGVGTRGKGANSWLEGGSVANAVVRQASASVLVARRLQLAERLHRHIESAREEAYGAETTDDERLGLIGTLRAVRRLADESRELEHELLHEAVAELERLVAQVENDRPRLATSLSAIVRALSRMGI